MEEFNDEHSRHYKTFCMPEFWRKNSLKKQITIYSLGDEAVERIGEGLIEPIHNFLKENDTIIIQLFMSMLWEQHKAILLKNWPKNF